MKKINFNHPHPVYLFRDSEGYFFVEGYPSLAPAVLNSDDPDGPEFVTMWLHEPTRKDRDEGAHRPQIDRSFYRYILDLIDEIDTDWSVETIKPPVCIEPAHAPEMTIIEVWGVRSYVTMTPCEEDNDSQQRAWAWMDLLVSRLAYALKCRAHDWYYEMSDDHRVWRRGKETEWEVRNYPHIPEDMAQEIVASQRPR